jgi:3-phenylpropionate/trans-cinnamate dioxygenase ferredoxin reductase subunit
VGAGCIGLEIAATARGFGNAVTVVGRTTVPLADALGDELGAVFEGLHREHGVRFRLSTECAAVDVEGGWIAGVVTAAGDCVPADLVVVGVGVVPEVALAAGIGLPTANGIEVGGSMATSVPGVFAADDVADAYLHAIERRLCSEHWANAIAGGRVAARGMPGERVSYNEIPYLYTDQYYRGMEYSGYAWLTQGAEVVYRGDPDVQEFLAFWTSGGWVVAGISLNVWDVNDQVQRIIRTGKRVDSASAADVDIPLSAL